MPFPIELVALVIGNVDNARTLNALLPLSKDVFLYAVAALYKNPLWPELTQASGNKLIDWLLTISPAEDEATNMLRQIRGITPQSRQEVQTIVDYLGLVTAVQWANISWWGCLNGWIDPAQNGRPVLLHGWLIRSALTSAICGHRLENIEHLSIDSADLDKYTNKAARLCSISSLYIHFTSQDQFRIVCNNVVRLVEAIQEQHGTSQLQTCQLAENVFHRNVTRLSLEPDIQAFHRLQSLLPPDLTPLHIPCSNGSSVVLNRPLDMHLSKVDCFFLTAEQYARNYFRDLSKGQFFQRCRSLTEVRVDLGLHNANVFEWARDEARQRDVLGAKMPPPVPMLTLECYFTRQNHPPYDLQDVEDALDGFASTLLSVKLNLVTFHDGASTPWRLGEISRPLAQLKSIVILLDTDIVIHPSLWDNCLSLEELSIRKLKSRELREGTSGPTGDATGDASWLWPAIKMPSLKKLELLGPVSALFHPRSFIHMPRLERIIFNMSKQPEWMAIHPMLSLPYRWQSGWNWSLPNLTVLELHVDISQLRFDFHLLQGCPRLQAIQIYGISCYDHSYPLRVRPDEIEDNTSADNHHGARNDVFPQLRKLNLQGSWSANFEELKYLYCHMLPGLTDLRLGRQVKISGCNDREWIEATRTHPCCTLLAASNLPMTCSLQELGLEPLWAKGVHSRSYHFADDVFGYLPL